MYRHESETEKVNRFIKRSIDILARKEAEKEREENTDKDVIKNIRKYSNWR